MNSEEDAEKRAKFYRKISDAAMRMAEAFEKEVQKYYAYTKYLPAFAKKHDLDFIMIAERRPKRKYDEAHIVLIDGYGKREQLKELEISLPKGKEITDSDLLKIVNKNTVAIFESEPKFLEHLQSFESYRFLMKKKWGLLGSFKPRPMNFEFKGLKIRVMKPAYTEALKEFCEDYRAMTGNDYTLVNRLGNPVK